ncbi:MAG: hypothetical protein JWR75_316 [Devosia sp.]|nr:hypothetical protein [Devosia sp.]
MRLAEINIGRLKHPIGDPRIADFVDNLGRINALAERMPGFVWRLSGDGSNDGALDLRPFPDPDMAVNMSVWETPEALEHFVWNTVHKRFYARKAEWFDAMISHHFCMWFIEDSHIPTISEAKARIEHLDAHGNSEFAFNWSHLEHIKLWQRQRCA